MRVFVSVVCFVMLLAGCSDSDASMSSTLDHAPVSITSSTTPAVSPPVTNSEGEVTGDPYAQCEITQSTAQPEPPNCVGDPNFEWERAHTVEPREGGGWLTEGVILSKLDEAYVSVGFRLSEDCVIDRFVVDETSETVMIGLHYWAFDEEVAQGCANSDKKWALRGELGAPLGERDFVVHPLVGDWELVSAESDEFKPEGEAGLITIKFTETGLTGVESCAPYSGSYHLDGNTLKLDQIETTAEGCGDWTGGGAFARFPREDLVVAFEGERLVLSNSTWRHVFTRVAG